MLWQKALRAREAAAMERTDPAKKRQEEVTESFQEVTQQFRVGLENDLKL